MSEENINIARIGGTQQSGANVVDVANTALRVNVVAGSAAGGDASAANQLLGNASLASIDTKTPASPATSGKQDTANTSLASIDGHLDVALSTRLKAADTLAGVTTVATVSAVTAITNALPAGTNVIGHVIADSGSTTAVTGTVAVQGSVAPGAADTANPITIAANDAMGLVATIDCDKRDGQTQLLTLDTPVVRLLEQLLQEQRICNMLLVKLAEPYASSGWPNVTDPKTGAIQ